MTFSIHPRFFGVITILSIVPDAWRVVYGFCMRFDEWYHDVCDTINVQYHFRLAAV